MDTPELKDISPPKKEPRESSVELALKKYGEKVLILQDEDKNLNLTQLMEKYELPKATAWRLLGRGYVVRGYHEKSYLPDETWSAQNVERIEKLAKHAYFHLGNQYPDVFPPIGSPRSAGGGFWPEDLIQEAILEIVAKSGSPTLLKEIEKETTKQKVPARELDSYLIAVAKHAILDHSKVSAGSKGKFGKETNMTEEIQEM